VDFTEGVGISQGCVGQSPPNRRLRLAAVRPSATTTSHRPYSGHRCCTASSSARASANPRSPLSASSTRRLIAATAVMPRFIAGTREPILVRKWSPGDDRQQKRLVAHHQMRFTAERRRKAGDRRLHLRGVGTIQQQETADQERQMGDFLDLRRIRDDRQLLRLPSVWRR
jgi:hypothetical protein